MDSGSKNLTFSFKNCEKLSRSRPNSSPNFQERKLQNKDILGFISDLIRDWLAMASPIPQQRPCPGGNNPFLAACTETRSQYKSFKPPFHNTPSSHDTQKLPVHAKINFGSSICPNSIPSSRTGSLTS
uniref:Uncharacterized protein n=1 Tax=Solanum tuberosum TaxID=4113 RepID=M1DKY3_SOLTU